MIFKYKQHRKFMVFNASLINLSCYFMTMIISIKIMEITLRIIYREVHALYNAM